MDNDVKFRQIDLQIRLLELYTDIPIRIKNFDKRNRPLKTLLFNFLRVTNSVHSDEMFNAGSPLKINAAEFLLNDRVQRSIPKILLEGGPGQGKSTISQYICQVHRARLLKFENDLKVIPEALLNAPIKIPFKIDLRDVAKWIDKKNPYPDLGDDYFSVKWGKSLEDFLVYHIYYHSKITDFTINDLLEILELSPIIIVFDGFDEVAGTTVRSEIIDLIDRGVNRLLDSKRSIQVLITSRPAAISNGANFPIELYPHFELTDLTQQVTDVYVEKWIRVKNFTGIAAKEIRTLAKEKLTLPHLRDLSKSPMQLAILLSLLNTRGESLPHKRTALYESYVELFFNRESEKNVTIRNHRDLIIDLHQYLAWLLHSEAELYNSNGRIEIDALKMRLKEYLESEHHDTNLVEELFFALQERVCAIVSRTLGTFEFEVQPLREYFCAKYLYRTSPYSPAGASKSGSLPDRFKAIAKNYYWQNVARFFGGCFDRAQLAMLVDEIKDLVDDPYLRFTNYPRLLMAQLLSDWVFTQYPKYLGPAVKIIIDGLNSHRILNSEFGYSYRDAISVPKECGGKEIEEECFRQLATFPKKDYVEELISLIRSNSYNTKALWTQHLNILSEERKTDWLVYGMYTGVLYILESEILSNLLESSESELPKKIQYLVYGNRWDIIESSPRYSLLALDAILNNDVHLSHSRRISKPYKTLVIFTRPDILFTLINSQPTDLSLGALLVRQSFIDKGYMEDDELHSPFVNEKVENFAEVAKPLLDRPVSEWRASVAPWQEFVDAGVLIFGEKTLFWVVSAIAAGLGFEEKENHVYDRLSDSSHSMFLRVRYARHRSGNIAWWKNTLKEASDIESTLLIFFTWATPRTMFACLDSVVQYLDIVNVESLAAKLETTVTASYFNASYRSETIKNAKTYPMNAKFKYLVSFRFDPSHRGKFTYQFVELSDDIQLFTVPIKLDYLISKFLSSPNYEILTEIKKHYALDKRVDTGNTSYFFPYSYAPFSPKISYDLAKLIMSDGKNYPRALSNAAEAICRKEAGVVSTPVGKTAIEEDWFKDM